MGPPSGITKSKQEEREIHKKKRGALRAYQSF